MNKQRDPESGKSVIKMSDMDLKAVKGKTVVIIDDEVASGGSQAKAAALLKKAGAAKVIAIVTHVNGVAKDAVESPDIDELVFTNTLQYRGPASSKIRILDESGEIAQLIHGTLSRSAATECEINMATQLRELLR